MIIVGLIIGLLSVPISIQKKKEREIPTVSVEELSSNLAKYEGKVIRTKGYPEYVGERSYFIAYPYYDPILDMVRISFSEVLVVTYRLYAYPSYEGPYVLFYERTGGLYLPMLPVVTAPRPEYPEVMTIEGKVVKDKEGIFLIDLYKIVKDDS